MIYHLVEDPKFWLLISFIIFVILMVKPFKKMLIGGLDLKIEEIKENINESLSGFTEAQIKLEEATVQTNDLKIKIEELIKSARDQAESLSKVIIQKAESASASKEKNSIERIKQIELSAIQFIKSQTSIKLQNVIIDSLKKMDEENKKSILNSKINYLKLL